MTQTLALSLGALALAAGSFGLATSQTMPNAAASPSAGAMPVPAASSSPAAMPNPGSSPAGAIMPMPMPAGSSPAGTMAPMPSASLAPDAAFARAVQRSNDDEIASSRAILRATKNASVRAYAEEMIQEHSVANVSLQTASRSANVKLPNSERTARMAQATSNVMAAPGDSAYLRQQIAGHRLSLAVVTPYSASGKNPALKAYADNQVPVVTKHLAEAETLVAALPKPPAVRASVAPLSPGGAVPDRSATGGAGTPASPTPATSGSPNPQPSVDIPVTPTPAASGAASPGPSASGVASPRPAASGAASPRPAASVAASPAPAASSR